MGWYFSKLKTLHGEEKKILAQVLESVAELDRRKSFLSLVYPSLFEFISSIKGSKNCEGKE
jgi:hypothetical protein